MRDNEIVQHQSLTPPSSGLSVTQLKIAGINDPEEPEKYNKAEVKYGSTFYSCHSGQQERAKFVERSFWGGYADPMLITVCQILLPR
jgi:hypothetical protein